MFCAKHWHLRFLVCKFRVLRCQRKSKHHVRIFHTEEIGLNVSRRCQCLCQMICQNMAVIMRRGWGSLEVTFFCENERNVDLSESSVEKLIIVHSYVASCAWKCQHHFLHDLHWFAAACSSLYNNNNR